MRFLPGLLGGAIRRGTLVLQGPDGRSWRFGDGSGEEIRLRATDPGIDWRIALDPELAGPEAVMDGRLRLEQGTIRDLALLFFANREELRRAPLLRLRERAMQGLRWLMQANPVGRARRNAAHHYDLGNEFYRLWLDEDMQYSCGYFERGDETLEEAQLAKKRHIAAKLRLSPGQRVLDIGCGWGGMAIYLAQVADVEVTGITLSQEQLALARERAEAAGLSDRVRFRLADYREIEGEFDRIVSIGMAEHVGAPQLGTYFSRVRDLLSPEGVALIHLIGSSAPPSHTGPFLAKYIFPGGYTPSLSETAAAVEQGGVWTLDCEVWRLHYARTLQLWQERFAAVRAGVAAEQGERFARMWELYLAVCEATFRHGPSCVFQLQLGLARDAVPLTRDYLGQEKAVLERRERLAGIGPSAPERIRAEPAQHEKEERRHA